MDDRPWLTWTLVAAIVLFAWLVTGFFPAESDVLAVAWSPEALESGEWWRLATSVLAHGGLLHLVFNAMSLLALGAVAEQALGKVRYGALVVVSGVGGGLLHVAVSDVPVVGASGVVFGLVGWLLVVAPTERLALFGLFQVPVSVLGAFYVAVVFLVPQFSAALPIAHFAHLGGLAAGIGGGFWTHTGKALRNGPWIAAIFVSAFLLVRWLTTSDLGQVPAEWRAGGAVAVLGYTWPFLLPALLIGVSLGFLEGEAERE